MINFSKESKCSICGVSSEDRSLRFIKKYEEWFCRKCYSIKRAKENNDGCDICGSYLHSHYREKFNMNLCNKHNKQMKRHGKILKRTRYTPNKIKEKDKYAEVILYNKDNKEKARTKIDKEDIEKVKKYKWYYDKNGYVVSDSFDENKTKYLHRYLMKPSKEKIIDHINGNKLDNRKSNLRMVFHSENSINRKSASNFFNEDIGVAFDKRRSRWFAYIEKDCKRHYLGSYSLKENAIKARREAEIKYFGEYMYNYKELKEKGMV